MGVSPSRLSARSKTATLRTALPDQRGVRAGRAYDRPWGLGQTPRIPRMARFRRRHSQLPDDPRHAAGPASSRRLLARSRFGGTILPRRTAACAGHREARDRSSGRRSQRGWHQPRLRRALRRPGRSAPCWRSIPRRAGRDGDNPRPGLPRAARPTRRAARRRSVRASSDFFRLLRQSTPTAAPRVSPIARLRTRSAIRSRPVGSRLTMMRTAPLRLASSGNPAAG